MKKLSKSERFALLGEWLEAWRLDGELDIKYPEWDDLGFIAESYVYEVDVVQVDYGDDDVPLGVYMKIRHGDVPLSALFCKLNGEELCPDGSIYRKSMGSYIEDDAIFLADEATYFHVEAALAHKDLAAVRACDPDWASRLEVEWLQTAVNPVCQPKRQRRL